MQNQNSYGFQSEDLEKLANVLMTFLNEQSGAKLTSFAISGLIAQINPILQVLDTKLAEKENKVE